MVSKCHTTHGMCGGGMGLRQQVNPSPGQEYVCLGKDRPGGVERAVCVGTCNG